MSNPETSPFRKKGFIAAAIVVGVIALAAIIVLVTSVVGGSNGTPSPAPTSSPDSSPTAEPVEDPSVCGLEGFETENTLDAAPEATWELVGTVAAPTDPKGSGPGVVDDGFRSCYAHTAEGALYAAVNYIALASDSRNISRLAELVEPGAGRDAALEAATTSPTASTTRLQVAGFKVNSYDGQEAVIDVVWEVTSQNDALVSSPTVLHWVDGDWKLVLTDEGTPPFASSQIENLGGYIPWSGI
jgi:hypothetical protein